MSRPKILLAYKGEKLSLKDWSARVGLSADCIRRRLDSGWTAERALLTPVDVSKMNVPEVFQAVIKGSVESLPPRNWMTGL